MNTYVVGVHWNSLNEAIPLNTTTYIFVNRKATYISLKLCLWTNKKVLGSARELLDIRQNSMYSGINLYHSLG